MFPHFYKANNFCDFVFAVMYTKSVLKRFFFSKERSYTQNEQTRRFDVPFQKGDKTILTELSPLELNAIPLSEITFPKGCKSFKSLNEPTPIKCTKHKYGNTPNASISKLKTRITDSSRKHAYTILTPLNPTLI